MYDNNPLTFLNLRRLPARVDYQGAAYLLNFEVVAIQALVELGYLKPWAMDAVKKVARLLLERLRQVLVLDWRKRQSSRVQVEDTIKGLLDENLPRVYSPEIYRSKCETIFQHVFESYRGEGESIFSEVA